MKYRLEKSKGPRSGLVNRNWIIALFMLFIVCSCQQNESKRGSLLIIGGRKKPSEAIKRFVALNGDGLLLVIPSASSVPLESGSDAVKMFKDADATNVDWLFIDGPSMANADSVVERIDSCTGLFFTGGVQSRFMQRIGNTKSEEAIKRLYFERGGIIGGTSAGAAVQSEIMITGDGDWSVIKKDSVKTATGLGLIKNAIIDQHFVKRGRNNRLLTLCIEKNLAGIGIDESTAILLKEDNTFEVFGEGTVLVYDPRPSNRFLPNLFGQLAAGGIRLSVLPDGYRFDLNSGKIIHSPGK